MWNRLTRVEPPATALLALAEAKAQLRVTHSDDDALITGLIDTATAFIEGPNGCGVALVEQTWRASLDAFPCDAITLPLGPVESIDAITFTDGDGDAQTLDPETYVFDSDTAPARIVPAYGHTWPVARCQPGSVKVTFVTGYGEPGDVPADLRHAALMLISHLYENRDAAMTQALHVLPFGVESILNRYRVAPVA